MITIATLVKHFASNINSINGMALVSQMDELYSEESIWQLHRTGSPLFSRFPNLRLPIKPIRIPKSEAYKLARIRMLHALETSHDDPFILMPCLRMLTQYEPSLANSIFSDHITKAYNNYLRKPSRLKAAALTNIYCERIVALASADQWEDAITLAEKFRQYDSIEKHHATMMVMVLSCLIIHLNDAGRYDDACHYNNAANSYEVSRYISSTLAATNGSMLLDHGFIDQAQQELIGALQLSPHSGYAISLLGNIHALEGRPNIAKKYYKKAIKIKENDYFSKTDLAELLQQEGHPEEAKQLLIQALKDNLCDEYPNHLEHYILSQRGRIYANLGWHENAEVAYLKCIERFPFYLKNKIRLAELYINTHRYDEASKYINDVIKHDPHLVYAKLAKQQLALVCPSSKSSSASSRLFATNPIKCTANKDNTCLPASRPLV